MRKKSANCRKQLPIKAKNNSRFNSRKTRSLTRARFIFLNEALLYWIFLSKKWIMIQSFGKLSSIFRYMIGEKDINNAMRRLNRLNFQDKEALAEYQREKLQQYFRQQLANNLYYRPWLGKPSSLIPMMDTRGIAQNFSTLCRARLGLSQTVCRRDAHSCTRRRLA